MATAEFRRERERMGKVPLKTKIIYALGEMPGSHMNSAIGAFLALYYIRGCRDRELLSLRQTNNLGGT